MTTLESSFDQTSADGQKTSGLAIASLVCSLICCLPFTTVPGVILGIVAIISIRGNPAARKGMGIAVTGLVLGLVFTGVQAVVYPTVLGWGIEWYRLVSRGPDEAMAKGMSGDIAGFKAAFDGAGATASDAEAQAFLDAIRDRYGSPSAVRWDQQSTTGQYGPIGTYPYVFEFPVHKDLEGEAEIVFSDPQRGLIMKLVSITILDPDLGDLTYPTPPGQAPPGRPPGSDATAPPAAAPDPNGDQAPGGNGSDSPEGGAGMGDDG